MLQPDNEKSWYAFKIFFGKGKPIKAYFVTNEIEHIYDVKQEYWDKNKKKKTGEGSSHYAISHSFSFYENRSRRD